MTTRLEKDSFGTIAVASDRLWGAQTQRSLAHFAISTERMPEELIHDLLHPIGQARNHPGQREGHRLAALVGAIELLAIFQRAAIANLDGVARLRIGARTLLGHGNANPGGRLFLPGCGYPGLEREGDMKAVMGATSWFMNLPLRRLWVDYLRR